MCVFHSVRTGTELIRISVLFVKTVLWGGGVDCRPVLFKLVSNLVMQWKDDLLQMWMGKPWWDLAGIPQPEGLQHLVLEGSPVC